MLALFVGEFSDFRLLIIRGDSLKFVQKRGLKYVVGGSAFGNQRPSVFYTPSPPPRMFLIDSLHLLDNLKESWC